LKQGSQLTKQSTYRGNPSQVANNILERASGVANTASGTTTVDGQSYKMM